LKPGEILAFTGQWKMKESYKHTFPDVLNAQRQMIPQHGEYQSIYPRVMTNLKKKWDENLDKIASAKMIADILYDACEEQEFPLNYLVYTWSSYHSKQKICYIDSDYWAQVSIS
jgi:hypothetical protein